MTTCSDDLTVVKLSSNKDQKTGKRKQLHFGAGVKPLEQQLDVQGNSQSRASRQRRFVLGRSLSLTVADWAGKWKEAFGLFDKDGDGLISGDELLSEMRRFGVQINELEIRLLLSQWDTDGKGALTLLEFTSLMNSSRCLLTNPRMTPGAASTTNHRGLRHRQCCQQSEDGASNTEELLELRAAFDLFDRDGDGLLNREEIRLALELLEEDSTDEDVNQVLLAADANGNGCVSFKEFCRVLQSGGSGAQFPGKSTYRPRSTADGVN